VIANKRDDWKVGKELWEARKFEVGRQGRRVEGQRVSFGRQEGSFGRHGGRVGGQLGRAGRQGESVRRHCEGWVAKRESWVAERKGRETGRVG
jgi:hypothetical protein